MSLKASRVQVGDAAVSLGRGKVTIRNLGTGPVYLGGSGVTATAGLPLKGDELAADTFAYTSELFAVSASGATNELAILRED